jgi:hypothetical protein
VQLFVDRARAADAAFVVDKSNAPSVVRLCRRLDGVPLALELAAARVNVMSPEELAGALDHRFEVLAGGRRGAVKRQQTLRATIDWSYDLLTAAQQRLLARLAAFAGGCTRAAADAVCAGEPIEPRSVFALLTELVERSLVVAERDRPETRYRLLETIREYGEDRLAEHRETEMLRSRHAEYYCDFAHVVSEQMIGPDQIPAGRRLAVEHENLLAVWNYAIDTDNADLALRLVRDLPWGMIPIGYRLRLAVEPVLGLSGASEHSLYPFALSLAANQAAMRGDRHAAKTLCEGALDASGRLSDPDSEVEILVWGTRGVIAFATGATHEAGVFSERGAEIARAAPSRSAILANYLGSAATYYVMAGEADAALPLATEGLALARRLEIPSLISLSLAALAGALVERDPEQARARLLESIQLRTSLGYENWGELTQAALVSARLGDWPQTLALAAPSIRHLHWIGEWPLLGAIVNLVARALAPTDPETAAVLQGVARKLVIAAVVHSDPNTQTSAATSTTQSAGAEPSPAGDFVTQLRRTTTGMLNAALGHARLEELRAEGEAMDRDQAVAYALEAISNANAS